MDTCFYSCSSSVLYHWAPVDYSTMGWGSGNGRPFPKAVSLYPSLPIPSTVSSLRSPPMLLKLLPSFPILVSALVPEGPLGVPPVAPPEAIGWGSTGTTTLTVSKMQASHLGSFSGFGALSPLILDRRERDLDERACVSAWK